MGEEFIRELLSLCLHRLALEENTQCSELGKIFIIIVSLLVLFHLIRLQTQINRRIVHSCNKAHELLVNSRVWSVVRMRVIARSSHSWNLRIFRRNNEYSLELISYLLMDIVCSWSLYLPPSSFFLTLHFSSFKTASIFIYFSVYLNIHKNIVRSVIKHCFFSPELILRISNLYWI